MDEVELEDSGRGLICKDPINMGNALFQLPLKIVIDKEKALEVRPSMPNWSTCPRRMIYTCIWLTTPGTQTATQLTQEFGSALPADINEYFAVALMLIKQKSLGERSFWCAGLCIVFSWLVIHG